MSLESLVELAAAMQATDLHLEPGLPAALRVQGRLETTGEPLEAAVLQRMVRQVVGEDGWDDFVRRRSADVARTLAGVRCRINALCSSRGPGLAVRLLPGVVPTVDSLNLHPALRELATRPHGLVLVSGPTGCGKSSTLAALLQEINLTRPCHIVTVEQPIEYTLTPHHALVRQRQVGRDTPSFEQALRDALREDPDVLMVGELRDPACMRLTLNAAETGHLVLTTVHASTVAEAMQRLVLAFPAEIQAGVQAQLADCLLAVVCQRLVWRRDLDLRVPICEILTGSAAARACIRQGQFFKLPSVMETAAADGMWTRERYQDWADARTEWRRPAMPAALKPERRDSRPAVPAAPQTVGTLDDDGDNDVLVIDAPDEDPAAILSRLASSRR